MVMFIVHKTDNIIDADGFWGISATIWVREI